jgi:hypothetical protein
MLLSRLCLGLSQVFSYVNRITDKEHYFGTCDLCSLVDKMIQRFEKTYCLHLHDRQTVTAS